MKFWAVKLLVLLNTLFFVFALSVSYSEYESWYDQQSHSIQNAQGHATFYKGFKASKLVEEFGFIIYLTGVLLSLSSLFLKIRPIWLWSSLSLLPLLTVWVLYSLLLQVKMAFIA